MKRLKKEYEDLGKYLKELENYRPGRKLSINEWKDNIITGVHVGKEESP